MLTEEQWNQLKKISNHFNKSVCFVCTPTANQEFLYRIGFASTSSIIMGFEGKSTKLELAYQAFINSVTTSMKEDMQAKEKAVNEIRELTRTLGLV